jgi:hypothetical protein
MMEEEKKMKSKPVAEWTVMVYMAGDNSLSAECIWALTEMKKAASSDQINVIAQFDPSDGLARTRRYEINKDGLHSYQRRSVISAFKFRETLEVKT